MNLGNCPFCHKPVFAGEGQMIVYLRETMKATPDGENEQVAVSDESNPTHKRCRKGIVINT